MGFGHAPEGQPTPKEIYNYRIYLLTILACLGSWMFGYQNGVISGVLVLPAFYRDFHLPPIGGIAGVLGTFPAMKYLGRKISLAIAAAVYFLGAALQPFCNGKLSMMYAGRFITGLGTGSVTVIVPLYIAEISPPSIRGSLVGIYEINNQLSSLMGYWCNYIVSQCISPTETRQWQIPLAMQMVPSSLLLLAAIFILPESPRFLVKKGNKAKARKVLSYVRHLSVEHEYINHEMEEIEFAIEMQERPTARSSTGRFGLLKELWWQGNRKRVIIGIGLMFGQNLTGIQGVNFYTPSIFKSIGFDGTRVVLLASGMYAVVKSVATLFSLIFFIDRAGRRKLLIVSSIGTSLALWYIGGFVTAAHVDTTKPQGKTVAGWIAIVCIYLYAAFFSFAWNGVVWVYCAEIFPTRIKELAACLTVSMQWLSQFAIARASPSMLSNLKGGFFFFFAACITIMGMLIFWCVPETKGRSLERMDEIFGTAYGGEVERELRDYRAERGVGVLGKELNGEENKEMEKEKGRKDGSGDTIVRVVKEVEV